MSNNRHNDRPRRHSLPRAEVLLRIDTTILRLTNQLDMLRSFRWDVDHGDDMRRAGVASPRSTDPSSVNA